MRNASLLPPEQCYAMSSQNKLDSSGKCLKLTDESSNCNLWSHDEGQESSISRSTGLSDLDTCLVLCILVKLPLKSIVACRCVCKAWNQLILDPFFATFYSKSSPFTYIVLRQYPKAARRPGAETFHFLEIGSNGDVIHAPLNPELLSFPRIQKVECSEKYIAGSCNGLLCFVDTPYHVPKCLCCPARRGYSEQTVWVINPLMGESMVMPEVQGAQNISHTVYGFGSTTDGNQYKIVRIVIRVDGYKLVAKILTVGVDDEWRDFDTSLIPNDLSLFGIALNGHLHWTIDDLVYAFDIEKENGHFIPAPPGTRVSVERTNLEVWNGHICFLEISELQVDIWTMKQYGVAESWTRDITLRSSIPFTRCHEHILPITTRSNGDLLLSSVDGEDFIFSYPNTKYYVELEEVFGFDRKKYNLLGYAPSFLSLDKISGQIAARDP